MSASFNPKLSTEVTSSFDPCNYATLINNKIVIPSSATNYVAVDKYFFASVMKPVIEAIHLDPDWYLQKYDDVKDAIRQGTVTSARQHYVEHGFYEHRMPYAIAVDEAWYLDAYPDIKGAIADGSYPSGQTHFEDVGYGEGRLPFPEFVLRRRQESAKPATMPLKTVR